MKTGSVKVLYWSLRQRERPVIQYPSHSKCWHFVHWRFLAYCLIPETIIFLWYTLAVQWLGFLFSLPRARVQSLVGKLRSHKLCSVAQKGGKKEKKKCFSWLNFSCCFGCPFTFWVLTLVPAQLLRFSLEAMWEDRQLWQCWDDLLCAWG